MHNDAVNNPSHYTQGGIEVIEILRQKLTKEEYEGFCKANVLKYIFRSDHKNGVEDLQKAKVYLGWLIESKEGNKDGK